ncbi:hypothetical protein PRIPAC_76449 [Pristionchus pacificus]|uniref:non-specific serine/threonine protein kinase n=1 Tax=Pristionchus pacificus TaxID=54126 RepID=A0A2A6CT09_PRIPA|nr:hypothetical protein PRIPAC_76449 [Pristionchus pacificus]|eukprot:PDM81197.1 protein kinase [Pristionchus pacificus]
MTVCFTPEAPKRARFAARRNGSAKKRKLDSSPCTPPVRHAAFSPSPSRRISFSPSSLSYFSRTFITLTALGEGDFGQVKRVQRKNSSEEFALKISKVDATKVKTGLHYTKEHLKEIRTHSSLPSHSNLVSFHQAWKEDGHAYLLMELCSGSLYGYWQEEKKMTEMEVKSALNDMLRALTVLSSLNIVHLDIKPHNVLRSDSGVYKLADFGTAVDLSKESSPEEFGDGRYAAPEILNGEFSLRADLFSLSITISQVSVPADAPLCADEWKGMKEDGKLPERVAKAHSTVAEKLQSMLLPLSSRPSVEEIFDDDFSSFEECKFENDLLRHSMPFCSRDRLSLPLSCERTMRERTSPLVKKSSVVFHTDDSFYEMEKPKTRKRASMPMRRKAIKFDLDD